MAQARLALDKGDLRAAQQLAEQAEALNVPDTAFEPGETRPWQMALEVSRAMYRREGVQPASASGPAGPATPEPRYPVAQGMYNPATDTTQDRSRPTRKRRSSIAHAGHGRRLDRPAAVSRRHSGPASAGPRAAMKKFQEAWKYQAELDPETRQQLKDKLTILRPTAAAQPLPRGGPASPLEQVSSQQELLRQKLVREILNEEKAAEQLAGSDPRRALANMQKLRDRVAGAEVEPAAKKQLLTLVDGKVNQLASFVEQNKATIENAEKNDAVKAGIVRDQELRIESQNKLAELVEQFNKLMDEKRFPEAEIIARQARDLVAERIGRRRDDRESAVRPQPMKRMSRCGGRRKTTWRERWATLHRSPRAKSATTIRWSSTPAVGRPDQEQVPPHAGAVAPLAGRRWKFRGRSASRSKSNSSTGRWSEVMDTLGRMAGINVHLDPQGLDAEGVTSDTPVTLNLTQPISLKSALNLMLSPLQLSYVIQNEVLQITSEQTRDAKTYAKVYYVADLVMPIPNFVPSYNMGMPGAIRESLNALGYGMLPRGGMAGPLTRGQERRRAEPRR